MAEAGSRDPVLTSDWSSGHSTCSTSRRAAATGWSTPGPASCTAASRTARYSRRLELSTNLRKFSQCSEKAPAKGLLIAGAFSRHCGICECLLTVRIGTGFDPVPVLSGLPPVSVPGEHGVAVRGQRGGRLGVRPVPHRHLPRQHLQVSTVSTVSTISTSTISTISTACSSAGSVRSAWRGRRAGAGRGASARRGSGGTPTLGATLPSDRAGNI